MKSGVIKLKLQFFQQDSGKEPVREWLRNLTKKERKMIGQDIKIVQENWPVGWPLVDNLGGSLWEVRSTIGNRIARIVFYLEKDVMVLLHGFIKKTQKTPLNELNLAKRRLSQLRIKK